MRQFNLDIIDAAARQRERLRFTTSDLERLRRSDQTTPLSLLLARRIEAMARERGFALDGERARIVEAARTLLVEEAAELRLGESALADPARPIEAAVQPEVRIQEPAIPCPALVVCRYDAPTTARLRLSEALVAARRTPVFWSRGRGLRLRDAARRFAPDDDAPGEALRDPAALLDYILSRPNPGLAYVLEDFHHYLGPDGALGPEYGELRALVRELAAAMEGREETVCLLVPAAYELPAEVRGLFDSAFAPVPEGSPLLDRHARLLTSPEVLARLKPVIGVEATIERVLQILGRMEANNPLLVGHPGVGKTAVAEGLAQAVAAGDVPRFARGRRIYDLSLSSLVAGTRYRGDLEARVDALLREVVARRDEVIIFIDELHSLARAGRAEGSMGVGELLKPALSRGDFPCIGATTLEGERLLADDPALARRFCPVPVAEPDPGQCLRILRGLAPTFERHHGLRIAQDALKAAVDVSVKRQPEARLPAKAVALLDGAAAWCALRGKDTVQVMDIFAEMERLRRDARIS